MVFACQRSQATEMGLYLATSKHCSAVQLQNIVLQCKRRAVVFATYRKPSDIAPTRSLYRILKCVCVCVCVYVCVCVCESWGHQRIFISKTCLDSIPKLKYEIASAKRASNWAADTRVRRPSGKHRPGASRVSTTHTKGKRKGRFPVETRLPSIKGISSGIAYTIVAMSSLVKA